MTMTQNTQTNWLKWLKEKKVNVLQSTSSHHLIWLSLKSSVRKSGLPSKETVCLDTPLPTAHQDWATVLCGFVVVFILLTALYDFQTRNITSCRGNGQVPQPLRPPGLCLVGPFSNPSLSCSICSRCWNLFLNIQIVTVVPVGFCSFFLMKQCIKPWASDSQKHVG